MPIILQGRRESKYKKLLEQTLFFHVILENIKFLHVKNIWGMSLFIEQDISDKK